MPNIMASADVDDLVERYFTGEGAYELAKLYGVGKSTIYRMLEERHVPRRRMRNHEARASVHVGINELCNRALTRELNVTQQSPTEQRIIDLLMERSAHRPIPQKAIGPYNVDIALDPLVIEVWGGGWHHYGAHLERFEKRTRYILDAGWWQVVLRVQTNMPLIDSAVDKLIALHQFASGHPTARRQHWMMWGNGKPVVQVRHKIDDWPLVQPY